MRSVKRRCSATVAEALDPPAPVVDWQYPGSETANRALLTTPTCTLAAPRWVGGASASGPRRQMRRRAGISCWKGGA